MIEKTITMKLIVRGILALLILAPAVASAQDRYGETEEQQILCKEAISVYVSYKKQKNYDEAYIPWKKACDVCPPTAREGMYSDGVRFAPLPAIMQAKRKPLAVKSLAELVPQAPAGVTYHRFTAPPARKAGARVADVAELVQKLRTEAKAI